MSCYKMLLKKSHKEVLAVIDKVIENKITSKAAAKELEISEHQFDELYEDVTAKLLIA